MAERALSIRKVVEQTGQIKVRVEDSARVTNVATARYTNPTGIPVIDEALVVGFGEFLQKYMQQAMRSATFAADLASAGSVLKAAELRKTFLAAIQSETKSLPGLPWSTNRRAAENGAIVGRDPLFGVGFLTAMTTVDRLAQGFEYQYTTSSKDQNIANRGLKRLGSQYGRLASAARDADKAANTKRGVVDNLTRRMGGQAGVTPLALVSDLANDKLAEEAANETLEEVKLRDSRAWKANQASQTFNAIPAVQESVLSLAGGREAALYTIGMFNAAFLNGLAGWQSCITLVAETMMADATSTIGRFIQETADTRIQTARQVEHLRRTIQLLKEKADGS